MTSAAVASAPSTPRVDGHEARAPEMTLSSAIGLLDGKERVPQLLEVETFFLKRLMEDLDPEDRAECYFYLLRCRILRTQHFETADARALYEKMHAAYRRAEADLRRDARRTKSTVARSQLRAFYQLAIYHYATLESIFLERNYEDSARRANEHKMELRRRSYAANRHVAHALGYTLVGLTSRYGNSFRRWGVTTLGSVLVFATLYALLDRTVAAADRIVPAGAPLFEYFYFSIVTFMTLGYGDLHPHVVSQMVVSSVEVVMGYFMLGVLINMMYRQS